MSAAEDAKKVARNIELIYSQKVIPAVYGLAQQYAALALSDFRSKQGFGQGNTGEYWTNRTEDAVKRVFTSAFLTQKEVGFFIAHAVEYGIYLELANDRKHEALRPTINKWGPLFLAAVANLLKRIL